MRLTVLSCLAALSCHVRPPEVCGASGTPWSFQERSQAWGLDGAHGTRLSAADLDGDGYPDLVAMEGDAFGRDSFDDDQRFHFVLMNRPTSDGGRTFVDATIDSGLFAPRDADPSQFGRAGQLAVFGDLDGDGDVDALVGQFYDRLLVDRGTVDPGDRTEVMLNDGTGHFTFAPTSDVTVPRGYATTGASLVDVDRDGILDVWITGWYVTYGELEAHQDELFRGVGDGTFTRVTEGSGLEMIKGRDGQDWIDGAARRPGMGATACDLDGDGREDLLATNYGRSWNQQWMQQEDGTFVDVARTSGFSDDGDLTYDDNAFYRCWCAVNGCTPDPGPSPLADCAANAASWTPGWDDQPHRLAGNSFSTVCADVDDDGDMDLLTAEITHWWAGEGSDATELLLNDGTGRFSRPGIQRTGLARTWPSASWDQGDLFAAMADLDNDGDKDLLVASTDYPDTRLFTWRHDDGVRFTEVGPDVGLDQPWPASLAIADFDLDGDLDVVSGSSTTRTGTPWTSHELHLYENQLDGGNALRLRLHGKDANTSGIGARVQVTTGDRTTTWRLDGGQGHMAMQHDLALHVGLGEACTADDVVVTWPDGTVDHYPGVRGGYAVTLKEGGGARYGDPLRPAAE
ncbi:MAG: CRTAC1 family protein [Alphaproteobacteria bacterium]|nr:CRTAC1 family protein [Alphaproteobacteria bacterium]